MLRSIILFFIFLNLAGFSYSQNADSAWSLQKCVDYALNHNVSVRQSEINTESSKVTLAQSKANRVPTLTAGANQGFSWGRSLDPTTNSYINQSIKTNNVNLSGSIVLFNGLQVQNQIRQNKLNYEAGSFDIEAARSNLILSVLQYYYQILLAQEQVESAKINLSSDSSQIDRAKKQVTAGTMPEINLTQLQAQLASDRVTLINAENQVYLSKVSLMQLMNMPMSNNFNIEKLNDVEQASPQMVGKSPEEIYQEALTVQPSIKSLQLKKESSVIGLKAANGSKYPRLTLSGQIYSNYSSSRSLLAFQRYQETPIGFLSSNPSELVSTIQPIYSKQDYGISRQFKDNLGQSVSLNLSIPILNNRQARTNVDRAHINIKLAELQEESGKIQMRQNVEQAYANMKSAENSYNASKENMNLLEKTYNNAERRFNIGVLSPYDFVIQKNNFFSSKLNYAQTKYQYILNAKVLEFYQKNQL